MDIEKELFEGEPKWKDIRDLFEQALDNIPGVKERLYEVLQSKFITQFESEVSPEHRNHILASYIVVSQKIHFQERQKPINEKAARNSFIFYQKIIGNMRDIDIARDHNITDSRVKPIFIAEKASINSSLIGRLYDKRTDV